jgi:hypothetical protein
MLGMVCEGQAENVILTNSPSNQSGIFLCNEISLSCPWIGSDEGVDIARKYFFLSAAIIISQINTIKL